jgi:hypothetical protein
MADQEMTDLRRVVEAVIDRQHVPVGNAVDRLHTLGLEDPSTIARPAVISCGDAAAAEASCGFGTVDAARRSARSDERFTVSPPVGEARPAILFCAMSLSPVGHPQRRAGWPTIPLY